MITFSLRQKKKEIGPVLLEMERKRAWYAIFLAEVIMNSGEIDSTDEQQYNVTNSDWLAMRQSYTHPTTAWTRWWNNGGRIDTICSGRKGRVYYTQESRQRGGGWTFVFSITLGIILPDPCERILMGGFLWPVCPGPKTAKPASSTSQFHITADRVWVSQAECRATNMHAWRTQANGDQVQRCRFSTAWAVDGMSWGSTCQEVFRTVWVCFGWGDGWIWCRRHTDGSNSAAFLAGSEIHAGKSVCCS